MKNSFFFKNIWIALILTLSFFQATAQFSKGTWLTETSFGNIGFGNTRYENFLNDTTTSTSEGNYFSFDIYPRLGYFISDKLAVGTEFEFYFYSNNYKGFNKDGSKYYESNSSNVSLAFTPFVRYYFHGNEVSKFYGQASLGTYMELSEKGDSKYFDASGNVTSTYKTDYVKNYRNYSGSLLVGWNRFIAKNIALNLNLGYMITKSTSSHNNISIYGGSTHTDGVYKSNYFTGGLSWSMGFTMIIPGKNSGN
jgi:hypothetical protein